MNTLSQSPLLFRIEPLENETHRACTAIAHASLPRSRAGVFSFILYFAIAGAAYVFTPATASATIAISVAAVVIASLILQADGRSRIRRMQRHDPHSRETHFVELSPDGIRTWCDHIEARYAWSEFTKVVTNKEFYLFVRPSGNGSAVPRRLLDATTDVEFRVQVGEWAPHLAAALASTRSTRAPAT